LRVEKGVFRVPTFSDVVAGEVGIEGTGTSFRIFRSRGTSIRVPDAITQVITHSHLDHMPAIVRYIITPTAVALKVKHIYRQYGLKPKVIPWKNYRRTFHFNKGRSVFSSAVEFPDFVVIGESTEQNSLINLYRPRYRNGVVVRTPPRDTDEDFVVIPEGWFLADNTIHDAGTHYVLPKVCPTLWDIDLNNRIEETVFEALSML